MAPTEVTVEVGSRTLKLTNLEKVLYPDVGFTKAAVIDYYVRIAPTMLTHVGDRGITMRRYPDGVDAESLDGGCIRTWEGEDDHSISFWKARVFLPWHHPPARSADEGEQSKDKECEPILALEKRGIHGVTSTETPSESPMYPATTTCSPCCSAPLTATRGLPVPRSSTGTCTM